LNIGRAEIGIAMLIAFYIFVVGYIESNGISYGLWIPYSFVMLVTFVPTSPFVSVSPMIVFVFFAIAGLILYISDRKGFFVRRHGNKIASTALIILGFVLIVESVIEGMAVWGLANLSSQLGYLRKPLTLRESVPFLLALAFDGFGFLSGALLFSDGKLMENRGYLQPLGQKLDVETQTKYPKDLFEKYVERYPHNPEGVLEWHINKKMREGKTREQATKELERELLAHKIRNGESVN